MFVFLKVEKTTNVIVGVGNFIEALLLPPTPTIGIVCICFYVMVSFLLFEIESFV